MSLSVVSPISNSFEHALRVLHNWKLVKIFQVNSSKVIKIGHFQKCKSFSKYMSFFLRNDMWKAKATFHSSRIQEVGILWEICRKNIQSKHIFSKWVYFWNSLPLRELLQISYALYAGEVAEKSLSRLLVFSPNAGKYRPEELQRQTLFTQCIFMLFCLEGMKEIQLKRKKLILQYRWH